MTALKKLNRIKEWFLKLRTKDKIMAVTALVLTISAIIIAPTVAWFSYQKHMATMAKINSPAKLSLRSGAGEDIIQFKMSGIDVTDGNKKDFVFCVEGEDISQYNIQLAHTTNINFTYNIYKAVPTEDTNGVKYVTEDDETVYYKKDNDPISGGFVNDSDDNASSRKTGNAEYEEPSYKTGDKKQKFAEPLYWQTGSPIVANNSTYDEENDNEKLFRNYYVLEVSWNNALITNDKETDLIYLTAQVA